MKSQRIQKKNNDSQKIEKKKEAKVEQYLEEHIERAIWAVFACADFHLVPNYIPAVRITWFIWYLVRD